MHSSFFELIVYVSGTCDAQGRINSSKIHEYQKLRNYGLSGCMPGRVYEATGKDVVMITCIVKTPLFYSFPEADLVFGDFDYV